jgi:hypothetical protein
MPKRIGFFRKPRFINGVKYIIILKIGKKISTKECRKKQVKEHTNSELYLKIPV